MSTTFTVESALVSPLAAAIITVGNHGIVSPNGDGTCFMSVPAPRIRVRRETSDTSAEYLLDCGVLMTTYREGHTVVDAGNAIQYRQHEPGSVSFEDLLSLDDFLYLDCLLATLSRVASARCSASIA